MTETTETIWTALLKVQARVSVLNKDEENQFLKNRYLSLPGLLKVLQPVLTENKLVVSQHPLGIGKVETKVVYVPTGETLASTIELPLKDQTPQGGGSAITYARRYALMAIFNIAAEDDDGNAAQGITAPVAKRNIPYVTPTAKQECKDCEAVITPKIAQYSNTHYGANLCMDCQKKHAKKSELTYEDDPFTS